ncbi:MAG: hypothetical protein M1820_008912 [Bogoriella megaspora]|nr:MAG: hypothetical protein M1820_008912 [Bogoriella megaspora]
MDRDGASITAGVALPSILTGIGMIQDWPLDIRWVVHNLAKEFNLATDIKVEKVEAAAEGVVLILDTLQDRANDIPCDNNDRIDFNAIAIIAALTGCRPGVLEMLTFGQFRLAHVQDSRDWSSIRLVASVELERNKQRRTALLSSKPKTIQFSVTLVLYKITCLASIIFSRTLVKDASDKVSLKSAEALIHRPNIEDAGYIELP